MRLCRRLELGQTTNMRKLLTVLFFSAACQAQMMQAVMGGVHTISSGTTLTLSVGANNRDGEWYGATEALSDYGSWTINGDQGAGAYVGTAQFQVTGPVSGDTITAASIAIYQDSGRNASQSVVIKAGAIDNAPVLNATHTHDAAGHYGALTTASAAWTFTGAVSTWFTSPDIKSVVQEVVSRGGWTSGNYIGIVISQADGYNADTFDDYAGNVSKVAVLSITYTHP